MDKEETGQENPELLSQILARLDERISRIERHLSLPPIGSKQKPNAPIVEGAQQKETLELQIGLYWFAKVGIAALITGVILLLLQPYRNMSPVFAPALGYGAAGLVLLSFRYLRKSTPFLAGYLLGSGLLLSFIATLRLHFLTGPSGPDGHVRRDRLTLLSLHDKPDRLAFEKVNLPGCRQLDDGIRDRIAGRWKLFLLRDHRRYGFADSLPCNQIRMAQSHRLWNCTNILGSLSMVPQQSTGR